MQQNRVTLFFRGISVQAIITVVMGLLELVVFAIMSRLLTRQEFGYYAALMGIIAITESISEAGLGSSVIQKKKATKEFISTAYALSLLFGILGSIFLFVFSPYLSRLVADESLTIPLRIMSFIIIFNSLNSIGNAQLYRELKFFDVGIIKIISFFIAAIIGIIMAYMGYGLYSIVTRAVLFPFIITIIIYLIYKKTLRVKIVKRYVSEIVNYGGWLTLGVILNNFTQHMDKLLLSKLISVDVLGSYNRPAGFVSSISTSVNSIFDVVLFPMLSSIQDEKEKIVGIFYRAIGLLNSFSVILACLFFFNAQLLVRLFFGEAWMDLSLIMQIISISVIFNIDSRLVDCFFRSLNYVKYGFYLRALGVVITVVSIIIGAQFDITGVAVSLVVANVSIILIKVTTLTHLVNASFSIVFKKWILAWKPAIIPILLGTIGLIFLPDSLVADIIICCVLIMVVAIEFMFMPKCVSQEYVDQIFPKIHSIVSCGISRIYNRKKYAN